MHNKEKIKSKIIELLDKLSYTELKAIYQAMCKFKRVTA
jgi:hypothetical protein